MVEISEKIKKKEAEPTGDIRVLVAEDDESQTLLIKAAIEKMGGFVVTYVNNTAEALEVLRNASLVDQPIELVFSDKGLRRDENGGIDAEGGFRIAEAVQKERLARRFTLFTANAIAIGKESNPTQLKDKGIDELLGKDKSIDGIENSLKASQEALRGILSPQGR